MVGGVGEKTASAKRPTIFISYTSQDAGLELRSTSISL